jgi:nucleoside 2-deoxyribosyltransferase
MERYDTVVAYINFGGDNMRIYLAGSFLDQKALRPMANKLWELGHEVTSTWLNQVKRPADMSSEEFNRKLAIKDIAEVTKADLIILDNRRSSGGKNCEWGVGLGQFHGKMVWLVGKPSNVFHYLADKQFSNWDGIFKELKNV